MEDELLSNLLAAAEETTGERKPQLIEDQNFLKQSNNGKTIEDSLVHTGLTDSSDDEDNRDFQSSKYNSFGKAVRQQLDPDTSSSSASSLASASFNWQQKPKNPVADNRQLHVPAKEHVPDDAYTDPIFKIRIVNPLVSSTVLKDRMQGRQAVSLINLRVFVENVPANTDWVVCGVIVSKTGRTSQKGNPFSIWTLSDLHGDLKTFSLFLFRSAYKDLWKCSIGTVVGVLNPAVFEKKQGSKDEACLSVDNVQKVMIIGRSKDYGVCKSTRKDGTACTSFVNKNRCEHCVYHVRQEYQKCSQRSELQSTFSGRGLNALRNKVLGKNEVFYAGKSFTAIPASKSRKLQARDEGRINLLSGLSSKSNNIQKAKATQNMSAKKKAAAIQHVEVSASRRLKDLELLKKLGGGAMKNLDIDGDSEKVATGTLATSSEVTLKDSKSAALNVIAKLKAKHSPGVTAVDVTTQNNGIVDENELSDLDFGLSDEETDKKLDKKEDNRTVTPPKVEIKATSTPSTKLKTTIADKELLSPPTQIKKPAAQVNPLPKKTPTTKVNVGFDIPVLSGIGNKLVDLSSPITMTHVNRANLNALKWVQRNGPIQKENPNKTTPNRGKKRVQEVLEQQDPKTKKIQESDHFSQRFKAMMAATSKHADLLEHRDNDEAEKYFNKLEMKEKMEEKMIGTTKVQCKAVRCLQCKYTSFSAADRCKQERHPLKVFDAMKRFFKCGDCGNRTVSLNVIPTQSCKKCGGGKWEKTGMMNEKIVVPKAELSIRGGEQEHINSNISNGNINLLVPDD